MGLETGMGTRERAERAQRDVDEQADHEDDEEDRVDLGQLEVFVLGEQEGADPSVGTRDAFDHRDHCPAHRDVLPNGIDAAIVNFAGVTKVFVLRDGVVHEVPVKAGVSVVSTVLLMFYFVVLGFPKEPG